MAAEKYTTTYAQIEVTPQSHMYANYTPRNSIMGSKDKKPYIRNNTNARPPHIVRPGKANTELLAKHEASSPDNDDQKKTLTTTHCQTMKTKS